MAERFKKLPPSPIEDWLKQVAPDTKQTRIRSHAHLVRIMHANGLLAKAEMVEAFDKAVKLHKRKLARDRKRGTAKDVLGRERELELCEDALDEANKLPND